MADFRIFRAITMVGMENAKFVKNLKNGFSRQTASEGILAIPSLFSTLTISFNNDQRPAAGPADLIGGIRGEEVFDPVNSFN